MKLFHFHKWKLVAATPFESIMHGYWLGGILMPIEPAVKSEKTKSQNNANSKLRRDNRLRFKGFVRMPGLSSFKAAIKKDGRTIYLGMFANPVDAAVAYDKAARRYHGEFARVNFPEAVNG